MLLADSLDAAERTARWWLSIDSTAPGGLDALAIVRERQGHAREALATRRRAWRDVPGGVDDAGSRVQLAIREGDHATADRLARARIADTRPPIHQEGLWWLALSRDVAECLRELEGKNPAVRKIARAWPAFRAALPALAAHAGPWAGRIGKAGNLAENLAKFCEERL